eukprot:TRINITY_DN26468_c0_g1_i2.p1 TRINITY_DN26468_c0_g1~~TRINITY_DN26468_c0_g1_i2.p1  ORF type:complete len:309 (+),score=74.31 TRINITY_DN26468_c0_g1_i2:194-1120(+)
MSTVAQLSEEMSACERKITAVRLKKEEKIQLEAQKVALIAKKREELVAAHQAAVNNFILEAQEGLALCHAKTEREIAEIRRGCEEANKRGNTANVAASKADARSAQMENEIKNLHRLLEEAQGLHGQTYKEIIGESDERTRKSVEEADAAVRDTALHASVVQEDALESIATMTEEVGRRALETEAKSQERSRYRELKSLVRSRGLQAVSDEDMEKRRHMLIQGWHDEWLDSGAMLHQTPRHALETVEMTRRATSGDSVRSRLRAVEKNMDVATQRQAARQRGETEGERPICLTARTPRCSPVEVLRIQ